MSSSCGFQTPIDSSLYQLIKAPNASKSKLFFNIFRFDELFINKYKIIQETNPDEEYTISCLMMVLLAVSLPRLTKYESSQYKPDIQGFCFSIFSFKLISIYRTFK